MPEIPFLVKIFFQLLIFYTAFKALAWVFGLDGDFVVKKDKVFRRKSRSRPLLMLRPLMIFVVIPVFLYFTADFIVEALVPKFHFIPDTQKLHDAIAVARIYLKWPLIAAVVIGLNKLVYAICISSYDGYNPYEQPTWVLLYRSLATPVKGYIFLLLLNIGLAKGIYLQLSPDTQMAIQYFFHYYVPALLQRTFIG
jgi:hypothetical protein